MRNSSRPYNIFISYRRRDAAGTVEHIYDRLKRRFGKRKVFMDVAREADVPGSEVPSRIKDVLNKCRIVLIVIGPSWATVAEDDGPNVGLLSPVSSVL
jgi:TIR domain-containing protein